MIQTFSLWPNHNEECKNDYHAEGVDVQIKEKFVETTDPSEKILLLTLAPISWGCRKLTKEFNTSERKAIKAKKLVAQKGILTSPDPKLGKRLPGNMFLTIPTSNPCILSIPMYIFLESLASFLNTNILTCFHNKLVKRFSWWAKVLHSP